MRAIFLLFLLVGASNSCWSVEQKNSQTTHESTADAKKSESPADQRVIIQMAESDNQKAAGRNQSDSTQKEQGGDKRGAQASEFFEWKGWKVRISDALLVLFNFFLVIFTAGLVVYTAILSGTTKKIWKDTDRQHQISNRAFVAPKVRLLPVRDVNGNIDIWRVFIDIENSGNTPTRNLRWLFVGGVDVTPDPQVNEFTLPAYADVRDNTGSGFLAPRSSIPIIDSVMTRSKIAEIIRGRGAHFIGRIDYEDVFGTKHLTKFCINLYGGPYKEGMTDQMLGVMIDKFDLFYSMCKCNNCSDSECKEYTEED